MIAREVAPESWAKADRTHFADGGTFDQIYQPTN